VVHDDGVTLTVPPGALLVHGPPDHHPPQRREAVTRGGFEQVGELPDRAPRASSSSVPAQLTFDRSIKDRPTVLLKPGDARIIAYSADDDKPTAYIGTLGIVAAAKGGDPVATVDAPKLARTPDDHRPQGPRDQRRRAQGHPQGRQHPRHRLHRLRPQRRIQGPAQRRRHPYCGFKFGAVTGASIRSAAAPGNVSSGVPRPQQPRRPPSRCSPSSSASSSAPSSSRSSSAPATSSSAPATSPSTPPAASSRAAPATAPATSPAARPLHVRRGLRPRRGP
jgi:hypothetical protein